MNKTITLFTICFILISGINLQSQVLLAKWTFPTGNATDSVADGGLPVNLSMSIHTEGGTSAIDFSKNGATTKSAQATGWDNGAMLKCWVIQVNTIAYENLKISSKMQTGGNNPGPRDFKVQYRIGITGTWTDVPNSTLVTANNWSSAVLDSLAVPEACKNQQSVFFRWIMTTNTNSSGGTVAATGINKIDDIYLTGKLISTAVAEHQGSASFSVSPNPAAGPFEVSAQEPIESIDITDLNGRIVFFSKDLRANSIAIQSNILGSGNYMVRIHTCSGRAGAKKVVVL